MQQYIFNIPETQKAKTLLNIIIATGYFDEIKKIKNDDFNEIDKRISKKEFLNDFKTSIQQIKNNETQPLKNLLNEKYY